jgi:single-strand DNA-binding protein
MANSISMVGNLTREPELRFTQSGQALCNFSIASNRRKKVGDEWEDVASFFNCTAWGTLGENIAASLTKGDRVLATGYMEQRSYETQEGEKRTVFDFTVNELGAELRYATVEVSRTERRSTEDRPSGGGGGHAEEPFVRGAQEVDL